MKYACLICTIFNCVLGPSVSHCEEGQPCIWQADMGGPSIPPGIASYKAGRHWLHLAPWFEVVVLVSCENH